MNVRARQAVEQMREILLNTPDPEPKAQRRPTGDEIDAKLMARLLALGTDTSITFRLRALGLL